MKPERDIGEKLFIQNFKIKDYKLNCALKIHVTNPEHMIVNLWKCLITCADRLSCYLLSQREKYSIDVGFVIKKYNYIQPLNVQTL